MAWTYLILQELLTLLLQGRHKREFTLLHLVYNNMGTMSSWALSSLRRVALDLQSFEDGRFPQEAAEAFVLHLELVCRELLPQEQLDGHCSTIND